MKKNWLHQDNYNKAKCKTCIFGETPVELSADRKQEINEYLITMRSSHICHTTDKTCYGAMELQAKIMFAMKVISEPTVEAFLKKAEQILNLKPYEDRRVRERLC